MKKKKMLVTGAQGFLGVRICQYYAEKFDVAGLGHSELDITDADAVKACMEKIGPDVVVHCAAISNTGYAQQHPDESERVNYTGCVNVARACATCGSMMVYMSSDQVYCGNRESGLLTEDMVVNPVNVYGRHKWAAEQAVAEILPAAVGLRLTWMFDHPHSRLKLNSNVLVNIMRAHEDDRQLNVPLRDNRGFTWVWDVVKRIEPCFDLPGGIYNFGCENVLNSYESFVAIAGWMGIENPGRCIVADGTAFSEHPRNLSVCMDKLRQFGIVFPSMEESVRQAMEIGDGKLQTSW